MARAEALEWLCGVAGHMANRPSKGIAHPCSAPCFDWEDNVHGASHTNKDRAYVKRFGDFRRNMTADGSSLLSHPLQPGSPNTVKLQVQSHAAFLGFTRRNPIIRADGRPFLCLPFAETRGLPLDTNKVLAEVHMSL